MLKFIKIFLFLFSAIVCYKIIAPIYQNIIPVAESLDTCFKSLSPSIGDNSIWQLFTSNTHFYIFLSVINVFTQRYLPEIINIHPIECMEKYTNLFLFTCVYFLVLVFVQNFLKYLNIKNKIFYVSTPLLGIPIFLLILSFLQQLFFQWVLLNDVWFYAYILLPAIAMTLFYEFEKYYVLNKKITKRQIIIFCCLLLINAFSNEYFRFVICFGLLFGFCLHWFFINRSVNKSKFFLTWLFISILNSLTFLTPNFKNWYFFNNNDYNALTLINKIPQMIKSYWHFTFEENILLLLIIAIFSIAIVKFVKNKEQNKRLLIFFTTIILSMIIFLIAINIGTLKYYNLDFTFEHQGIRIITKYLLLYLVLSLSGYLLQYGEKEGKINAIAPLIFLICCSVCNKNIFNFEEITKEALTNKRKIYIMERCFVETGKKNKIFYQYNRSWPATIGGLSLRYLLNLYDRNSNVEDYQTVFVCEENDNNEICEIKMRNRIKKDSNYIFSEEELSKLDFSVYKKYMWY